MSNKDFEFDEEKFDYELDTEIDKNHLDEELECQHSLFMKYSKLSKLAKRVYDFKWEEVKKIRSRIIKEIKTEDAKATVQIIEAGYRTDERHIEAKKEMIEAEYQWNIMDGAVMSLHQRKASLQNLIQLYLNEYWADGASGNIDGETRTAYEKHQKSKAKEIIKKKSSRRRKK